MYTHTHTRTHAHTHTRTRAHTHTHNHAHRSLYYISHMVWHVCNPAPPPHPLSHPASLSPPLCASSLRICASVPLYICVCQVCVCVFVYKDPCPHTGLCPHCCVMESTACNHDSLGHSEPLSTHVYQHQHVCCVAIAKYTKLSITTSVHAAACRQTHSVCAPTGYHLRPQSAKQLFAQTICIRVY